eukprot:1090107-Lingulodinium_polyedra.AAC.1
MALLRMARMACAIGPKTATAARPSRRAGFRTPNTASLARLEAPWRAASCAVLRNVARRRAGRKPF